MARPYYTLNLCLRELKYCGLPRQVKENVARRLIALKNLVLEAEPLAPAVPAPAGEPDLDRLFHLVRHACALGSGPEELDNLLVCLDQVAALLAKPPGRS